MKRAKQLVTIATIACLTLGSTISAFAEPTITTVVAKPVNVVVDTEYADLAHSKKTFYDELNAELGVYPIIAGMDDLNKKIYEKVFKSYEAYIAYNKYYGHTYKISYVTENFNRYAKVSVFFDYSIFTHEVKEHREEFIYYVDKQTMKEIDKDTFEAGVESQKVVEEELPTVAKESEAVMIYVRDAAEVLGLDIKWDSKTKTVTFLSDGEFVTLITVDDNSYIINDEIVKLSSAPALQDDKIYVPVDFITDVLNGVVTTDKDGNIIIYAKAGTTTKATTKTDNKVETKEAAATAPAEEITEEAAVGEVTEGTVVEEKATETTEKEAAK